jgi:hypothetical protein
MPPGHFIKFFWRGALHDNAYNPGCGAEREKSDPCGVGICIIFAQASYYTSNSGLARN